MNLKLKIRVQNCRNIEKKCDAIFENVIENIMNINVVTILYVIGIISFSFVFFIIKVFGRLYVRVDVLHKCGNACTCITTSFH
jgi:hypothetical protein